MQPEKKFNFFQTPNGNEIWIPCLGLAWKKFRQKSKFQVQLPENDNLCKEIIKILEQSDFPISNVDSSLYYSGGIGPEAAQRINQQVDAKYTQCEKPPQIGSVKHDQAIFLGSMHKILKFKHPFYNVPGKIMHFCRDKIPCFEPVEKEQREQVFVISYQSADHFMTRIDLAEKDSQMFIIRTKNKISFEEVLQRVNVANQDVDPITRADTFKIPIIEIKAVRVITQATQARLKFPQDQKKYSPAKLVQSINLQFESQPFKDRMEELTLTVEDEPNLKERRMVIRGPFWIVLKYKGKKPYFGMYVKNAYDGPKREDKQQRRKKKVD